ncbi:lipoyl(octanoyl) transferase LipB [Rubrivirga sp. IMCC43871]|uniref:lipoyl(octanoyl) transferase LipB n=1 Tax=Rubrivirga sp. IMCC43871 TaxID=3391575 RepID=UPI003990240E
MPAPAYVYHLGRVPYREAWALQGALQAQLVAAKRADPPVPLAHTVLVVEHPPVYTLGKSADASHVLASDAELAAMGAAAVPVDRGGDVTFHGPGQVVVYPILDLDRLATPEGEPLRDLHRYLRQLEEAAIRTCADWGVVARRVAGRTGVWVGPDARGDERKVCAMGVRCSRWVTMHGLAFNVATDLGWFDQIVPCGIDDRGVTTLVREVRGGEMEPRGRGVEENRRERGEPHAPMPPLVGSSSPSFEAVAERLVAHLGERLGLDLTEYRGEAAHDHLREITATIAT